MARTLALLALLQAWALADAQLDAEQATHRHAPSPRHREQEPKAAARSEEPSGPMGHPDVVRAKKAQDKYSQRAEAAIAGLDGLSAMLEKGLENKSRVERLAQEVVAQAQKDFRERREEALSKFHKNLETLRPSRPDALSGPEAGAAAEAASQAGDELTRLGREELHAVREGLRGRFRRDVASARGLWKQARQAARLSEKRGHEYARALRHAGAAERVYEGVGLELEARCDRLRFEAEEAGERAEDIAEERYERIWQQLEPVLGRLHDALVDEQAAREDALREATNKLRIRAKARAGEAREVAAGPRPLDLAVAATGTRLLVPLPVLPFAAAFMGPAICGVALLVRLRRAAAQADLSEPAALG